MIPAIVVFPDLVFQPVSCVDEKYKCPADMYTLSFKGKEFTAVQSCWCEDLENAEMAFDDITLNVCNTVEELRESLQKNYPTNNNAADIRYKEEHIDYFIGCVNIAIKGYDNIISYKIVHSFLIDKNAVFTYQNVDIVLDLGECYIYYNIGEGFDSKWWAILDKENGKVITCDGEESMQLDAKTPEDTVPIMDNIKTYMSVH